MDTFRSKAMLAESSDYDRINFPRTLVYLFFEPQHIHKRSRLLLYYSTATKIVCDSQARATALRLSRQVRTASW